MKKFIYTNLFVLSVTVIHGQVGIQTSTPDRDALLDVQSAGTNDKGLLLPKVALIKTTDPHPMVTHTKGLVVYNTNTSAPTPETAVSPGFYTNDGTQWTRTEVIPAQPSRPLPTVGDIKFSARSTNHDGWYLLKGQNINTLTTVPKNNAISLGFTTVLPNGDNRLLRMKEGTGNLGSTGGSFLVVIERKNLPNISYSNVPTSTSGLHSHTAQLNYKMLNGGAAWIGGVDVLAGSTTTRFTDPAGSHSHTFEINSGGSGSAFDITPNYISSNVFVYLGE